MSIASRPAAPSTPDRTVLAVDPADGTLPTPRVLLLDFGGVVVSTASRATWASELAARILGRAAPLRPAITAAQVEDSLRAGRTALSLWKNAASRRLEPRELSPAEIVADFLLADLPGPVRRALALDAAGILAEMAPLVADHHVRPGVPELLALCRERGIPLAIVSNAHSGRAHREILAGHGLAEHFGVQVYSDEIGIRKPHPDMIRRAAEALGATPAEAWYVGDTLDRDVAAGRRAGVGAVVITRDRRTDHPPFPVAAAPDLVLETPAELLAPLRAALDAPAPAAPVRPVAAVTAPVRRPALLLDHGGVLTTSVARPDRDAVVGGMIARLAARIGHPLPVAEAERAVAEGWERHRARKRERDAAADPADRHAEIPPADLWGDLVGAELPAPVRAALRVEAGELSLALHRAKADPAPRPGAIELLRWCAEHEVPVGIVSNTISGRGVREILARYGVDQLVGPAAYSDEIGVRKPGRGIFEAALAGLEQGRADVVYVGDKVRNDAEGGRAAGIGTVVLLRGGKDPEPALAAALAAGCADHVLDGPGDLIGLLAARLATPP